VRDHHRLQLESVGWGGTKREARWDLAGRGRVDLRERRLTRRVAIPGAIIDVEYPVGTDRHFAVFGIDLNADGIRLALPAEVASGEVVRMTFQLDAHCRLAGVDGRVVHSGGGAAGVRFVGWSDDDRLALIEFLDRRYSVDPAAGE